jgi:hypothetical protein
VQQGPFAPRALPRFTATTDPAATVSSSADFPASPVIRPTLLHRFGDGTRTVSPVAQHALVPMPSLLPRRRSGSRQSVCGLFCCLRPSRRGSASGLYFLTRLHLGSLALRPGDSLTILTTMALSVGFTRFVSSTGATQATGPLTLAPMGLTPTEHASLRWTHSGSKNLSAYDRVDIITIRTHTSRFSAAARSSAHSGSQRCSSAVSSSPS